MRIKQPLQTSQKSAALCLTHHLPSPFLPLHTHTLLPVLTKRRRKTRKFNNALERQDYLRRHTRCYAVSEISCALLSFCSHHFSPSLPPLLLYPPTPLVWLKTSVKKKPSKLSFDAMAISLRRTKLQIAGDVTYFGWVVSNVHVAHSGQCD